MKSRSLPPADGEVEDAPESVPPPEKRGALIISAAQDYQSAGEKLDQDGLPHGLFSMALLEALRAAPEGEPADRVFSRVKAFMQSEGRVQDPVLAGTAERLARPLFGQGASKRAERPAFAVAKVSDGRSVQIQGGLASGIRKNCELVKGDGSTGVRVRVTEVMGLSNCMAEVVSGDAAGLKAGDLMELDRWAAPDSAALKVWLPECPKGVWGEVPKLAEKLRERCLKEGHTWVVDPTEETPSHILSIAEKGWVLYDLAAGDESPVTSRHLWKKLSRTNETGGSRVLLYANFPPPEADFVQERAGLSGQGGSVQRVKDATQADYLLAGAYDGREILYSWLLPNATKRDVSGGFQLPVRTDWLRFSPAGDEKAAHGAGLRDCALKLARLKGWLCLSPPPRSAGFPYDLALKRPGSGELLREGSVYDGERFSMTLVADPAHIENGVEKRYVYVFGIDQNGESKLLFPELSSGSVENRVPYDKPEREIRLGSRDVVVQKPFGVDTYVLIASAEAVPNPEIFNSGGVRGRERDGKAVARSGSSALERFLDGVGTDNKASDENYPAGWSIDRITFLSLPRVTR